MYFGILVSTNSIFCIFEIFDTSVKFDVTGVIKVVEKMMVKYNR